MQSVINLFQDSDNSEIIKEKVDNKDNSDNYMLSHSLSQGSKFKDYQNKIYNNLEKSGSLLINENFDNMSDGSNLAKKSYDVLNQTKLTPQNKTILSGLLDQYNNTLVEYQTLLAKLSGSTTDYINRINPSNMYLNKNIKFTTGELAYVTNQGVVKLLPSLIKPEEQDFFNNESGCPKINTFISLDIPWKSEYNTPGIKIPTKPSLISGTPMTFKESCGNEGKSVYVDKIINDTSSTYLGCYSDNPASRTMKFIGGEPKESPGINIINGNFSQPVIPNNSYKDINNWSEVPGWGFNAVLANNADIWGFKKPYPYGNQIAVLQKQQVIAQLLYLPVGTYTVTFSATGRNCCDGSGKGNTVNVQINYPTYSKVFATFTPPIDSWQNYSFQFTIEQAPTNQLTFQGTWTASDRSAAIQNVKVMNSDSNIVNGNYTFEMCKQAAIGEGYRYFALQSANPSTGKGYCAVSNDYIAPTSKGTSYVVSGAIPIWASNTNSGISASLANNGSLTVNNSGGAAIFQTPNSIQLSPNYLGCYGDSGNRAMSQYVGDMTYDQCLQQAKSRNQKYFGLQYAVNPPVAQCFLSNDIGSTTRYGLAGNCQNRSGINYGGAWSNAVYNVSPDVNSFLILQDDGNMCIYRGTGPNDNQGAIWCAMTNGKQQKPDPRYAAAKGKYGKNWVGIGASLAKGDFIGSNDGSIYLIMQNDGNLVLYTSTIDINCKKMTDGNMGGGLNANALNKLSQVGEPSLVGSVAYIDENSNLYNYKQNNIALSNDYTEIKGFDSAGNDIPSAAFGNATLDGCKTACNSRKDCYGLVFDNENKVCYPKTQSMYPKGTKSPLAKTDLLVRKPMLVNTPIGISGELMNVDTIRYKNYKKSGKDVNSNMGLRNATSVEKQQVDNLKTRLDLLAKNIAEMSGNIHLNDIKVNKQSGIDTQSLFGLVNDTKKNITSIKDFNTTMDNILKDSDIALLYENYNYLFWSILAAGTVLVSLNVINKS
jgi:hypothetical protein